MTDTTATPAAAVAAPSVTVSITGTLDFNGIEIPFKGIGTILGTPQISFAADSSATSDSGQTADQS